MAEYDPQAIYEGLVRSGNDWADKLEAADLLDATTKSVLSQLALRHMEDGDAKSITQATTFALASNAYVGHLTAAAEARKVANKARVRYDAAKVKAAAMQTVEANARERIKRTGMD